MSDAPQALKIGDRVRMRSGGPLLVVTCSAADFDSARGGSGAYLGTVYCRWFDENGHINGDSFAVATLQVIEGAAK